MNCKQVYIWILTAEEPGAPSLAVREHLLGCRTCRRRQQHVLRLDREVQRLPFPDEDPAARVRLFRKLDHLPTPTTTTAPGAQRPFGLWHSASGAAAAVLVALGISLLMSSGGNNPANDSQPKPEEPLTVASLDDTLVPNVLKHDLHLAETFAPEEQLLELTDLAADLRAETLRLARQAEPGDLPLLVQLYERVLHEGVVGRVRRLPAQQHQLLVTPFVQHLRETETEMEQVARNSPPNVARSLHEMNAAARDTSRFLEDSTMKPPALTPRQPPIAPVLLETLVVQGLRLAEEEDPLRRAGYCTDVADVLVQSIVRDSEKGNTERATRFTSYVGTVMDRAVAGNLDRVDPDMMDEARWAALEQISGRATQATTALARKLEQAPAQARPGLERALEASRTGSERVVEVATGKGKEKDKKDKDRKERERKEKKDREEKEKTKSREKEDDDDRGKRDKSDQREGKPSKDKPPTPELEKKLRSDEWEYKKKKKDDDD